MSNHKNLIFFNKEGDGLNFKYNETLERFEGDLLFHQNSSDTFKTYGLYMMEKIPSFEYEVPGELTLKKFQLFNEYGLHFYGSVTATASVTKIEPTNNDFNFYSKWIYGENIDSKFPIGCLISFPVSYLEFTNPKKTYVVIGSKKGAIMILSTLDNATFESNYYSIYENPPVFTGNEPIEPDETPASFDTYPPAPVDTSTGIYVRGVNAVGVYNYIDYDFNNNLSNWNEPNFYDKYYTGKKLNIVGTKNNNGVVTVKEPNLVDNIHFEYSTTTLPEGSDLIIEVISRSDLPKIYEGSITLTYIPGTWSVPASNRLTFGTLIPEILQKPILILFTGIVILV